jgi:hypothetical protein
MRNNRFQAALGIAFVLAAFLVAEALFGRSGASPKSATLSSEARGTPIVSLPETDPARPVTRPEASPASTRRAVTGKTEDSYLQIGFDKLSAFPATVIYEIVNSNTPAFYYAPKMTGRIPDEVKALEGKGVALKGFMLPLKQEEGRVKEFILLKNQSMCCFGKPPNLNEWVHVTMSGKGVKPLMDRVVTIYGRLHVSEYQEGRQRLGIYRLDGEGISLAAGL